MKTETLIELQRSITQGEWRAEKTFIVGERYIAELYDWRIADENESQYKAINDALKVEWNANSAAIALVPELIAEVIRLRGENEALTRKLDIAYNGLTTVKKITDGSQPKDYPSVPTVAAYVLGELA